MFVFVGHEAPPRARGRRSAAGFSTPIGTIHGKRRVVESNWRLGVENGFDASHIFIHKGSPLCAGNDIALPLGLAPHRSPAWARGLSIDQSRGPIGLYDLLGESAIPVFEGTDRRRDRARGHFGEKRVADNISIWLPGVLRRSTPGRRRACSSTSGAVPVDATTHIYPCRRRRHAGRLPGPDARLPQGGRREVDRPGARRLQRRRRLGRARRRRSLRRRPDRGWVSRSALVGSRHRDRAVAAPGERAQPRGIQRPGKPVARATDAHLRREPTGTGTVLANPGCWSAFAAGAARSATSTASIRRSVPASTTARRRRSPQSACTRSCRCTFCSPATPDVARLITVDAYRGDATREK